MNAYSRLEARGFLLTEVSENYETFTNKWRGFKLVFSLKERWYRLYDYFSESSVIVTPKLQIAITQYMKEKGWLISNTIRELRETLGLSLKEVANACRVSDKTLRNIENGLDVRLETKARVYQFYLERGLASYGTKD